MAAFFLRDRRPDSRTAREDARATGVIFAIMGAVSSVPALRDSRRDCSFPISTHRDKVRYCARASAPYYVMRMYRPRCRMCNWLSAAMVRALSWTATQPPGISLVEVLPTDPVTRDHTRACVRGAAARPQISSARSTSGTIRSGVSQPHIVGVCVTQMHAALSWTSACATKIHARSDARSLQPPQKSSTSPAADLVPLQRLYDGYARFACSSRRWNLPSRAASDGPPPTRQRILGVAPQGQLPDLHSSAATATLAVRHLVQS